MRKLNILTVLFVAAILAGCSDLGFQGPNGEFQSPLGGTKQTIGTLGGAGAGAFIGSRIGSGTGRLAATAIGGLLGAFVGGKIGQSLDRADQLAAQQTSQTSLETAPTGQTSTWRNPNTGHYGTVTPVRTYQTNAGQYCREFQQTVSVGGQTQQAYGTACRQPDGSWQIAN